VDKKLKGILFAYWTVEELGAFNHFITELFRTEKPKTMIDACSKAFTHHYKQAFPDVEHKPLKGLRLI
jgi:hypothetical protein